MSTETEERPRVYLNSVHLKGFKSIEDLTIDFKKGLNILIGKNGAGKSNFMEAIYQVLKVKHSYAALFNQASFDFVSEDNHKFSLVLNKKRRDIVLDEDDIEDRRTLTEAFFIDDTIAFNTSDNADYTQRFGYKNKSLVYRGNLRALFVSMGYKSGYPTYLRFDLPEFLESISTPGTIKINLESRLDFWTYPETLNFMRDIFWTFEHRQIDSYSIKDFNKSFILEHLKVQDYVLNNLKFYTSIEDIRFSNSLDLYQNDKNLIIDNIKLEFKLNGNWLPWSQLSDGTRRLFYIITEVTFTDGLVLLEEPELGIHPHQFNLLMDFLKEQSEDKQIIISTHSPKALDHLSPEELDHILIAYYNLDKGTQIRHLTDKEIKKAQKYMKEVGFFSDYWMLSDLE